MGDIDDPCGCCAVLRQLLAYRGRVGSLRGIGTWMGHLSPAIIRELKLAHNQRRYPAPGFV
jgi:hypothetical protein